MSRLAGMVFPGFTFASSWSSAFALAQPASIKALGFNTLVLQTTYSPVSDTDTAIPTPGTVALSDITGMTQAAKNAGMKVCLKPHCQASNGIGQYFLMPGAQKTTTAANNVTGNATYNAGSPLFTSPTINVTQAADAGKRIVSPSTGHTSEIPNSGLALYGKPPAPAWTIIASVQDSTHLTMSNPASVSSGNAFCYIIDDVAVGTWFTNWTNILHNLLDAAASGGGADQIIISTENVFLMCYFESRWRTLIANLRRAYPSLEIIANAAGVFTVNAQGLSVVNDLNRVPFIDALDYIAISAYPNVDQPAGGGSLDYMTTNWQAAVVGLDAYATAWQKPLIFGEVGTQSRVGAGNAPSSSGTGGTPSQVDQATFVRAFLRAVSNTRWWAGFNWWNWYYANNNIAGEDAGTDFAPKAAAQQAFTDYLVPAQSGYNRVVDIGGAHYRL